MKIFDFKWVLIALFSILVISCDKGNDSPSPSSNSGCGSNSGGGGGGGDSGGGGDGGGGSSSKTTSSTTTARYSQNCTLETYTATWCGNCPNAEAYTDAAVAKYGRNNVIPIDTHSSDGVINDGSEIPQWGAFGYGAGGVPWQRLNRKLTDVSDSKIASMISSSNRALSSTVGLAINSSLNGATLSITVKSRFAQAITGAKLVVYVLEDEVYVPGSTVPNNTYNRVRRTSASDNNALGDVIPDQAAAAEYSKTYTVTVKSGNTPLTGWNSSKLSIAAMVVKSDNTLLNAQWAKVGQNQDFQIVVP